MDPATQRQLARGERMTRLLRQKQYAPYHIAKTIIVVYAGMNGFVDQVSIPNISKYEEQLIDYIDSKGQELIQKIDEQKKLNPELEDEIKSFLKSFATTFSE